MGKAAYKARSTPQEAEQRRPASNTQRCCRVAHARTANQQEDCAHDGWREDAVRQPVDLPGPKEQFHQYAIRG